MIHYFYYYSLLFLLFNERSARPGVLYTAQLPHLCKSTLHSYQWLGLSIDQCSVGVCGVNYLRSALRLLVEPLYDGIHGIHRDVFRAIDQSRLWPVLLIMRVMYTYSYGPWLGAKWMVESAGTLKEAHNT